MDPSHWGLAGSLLAALLGSMLLGAGLAAWSGSPEAWEALLAMLEALGEALDD